MGGAGFMGFPALLVWGVSAIAFQEEPEGQPWKRALWKESRRALDRSTAEGHF